MPNFPDLPLELQRQIISECIDIQLLTYNRVPFIPPGRNPELKGLGLSRIYKWGTSGEDIIEVKELALVALASKKFLTEVHRALVEALERMPELFYRRQVAGALVDSLSKWHILCELEKQRQASKEREQLGVFSNRIGYTRMFYLADEGSLVLQKRRMRGGD